jgi:hypothetical protein
MAFILLIWLHFLADFVLQNDKMALNKSTSNKWLGIHCLVYTIPFAVVIGLKFAVLNGILHFCVDWFTSRATTYLWKKEKRHEFFVVIGMDQAIHMSCLYYLYSIMFP